MTGIHPPCPTRRSVAWPVAILLLALVLPAGHAQACASTFRLLSLNLAFWAIEGREARLDRLARYVIDRQIDVIALQEVAGGLLLLSDDTAADLQRALRRRQSSYQRRTAFAHEIGRLVRVGNAMLSRCPITNHAVTALPEIAELERLGMRFRIGRNILHAGLMIGGREVRVATTHLCADCGAGERRRQLDMVLRQRFDILAGDLNIDRYRDGAAERPLYDALVARGYRDAVARGRGTPDLCIEAESPAADCTVGVTRLNGPSTRRVDYVWVGEGLDIMEAETVLDPLIDPSEPDISDHAGVLVTLRLVDS